MHSLITETGAVAQHGGPAAYAWLLVALPLLGAAILLVGGRATIESAPGRGTTLHVYIPVSTP